MTVYILERWVSGEEPKREVYRTYHEAHVMGSEWQKEDLDRRGFTIHEAKFDEP
jgi:hypothetical protein